MAFLVRETVLGVGNSYATVAYADGYFTDRANYSWAGGNAEKQAALIQATDYIDGRVNNGFKDEVVDATEIHDHLKRATCEYAVRALDNLLAPDPEVDASGLIVVRTKSKLGPLEREFQIAGDNSNNNLRPVIFRPYPLADMWLAKLMKPGSRVVFR